MKQLSRILTLSSVILFSNLLVAEAVNSKPLASEITLPTVQHAVAPILTKDLAGKEILMQFKVHSSGRVYGIKAIDDQPATANLARSLKRVLPHWQFEPARDGEGKPIIVEVILPIKVTGEDGGRQTLAMFSPAILEQAKSKS